MKMKLQSLLIGAAALSLSLSGCSTGSSGNNEIHAKDMIDYAKESEKVEIEIAKLTKTEDIERHYGSGFFFEDFSKEIAELNTAFEKQIEEELRTVSDRDFEIKAENEYYNDSLDLYRRGELSFADMYEAPEVHFRDIDYSVTVFEDSYDEYETAIVESDFLKALNNEWKARGVRNYEFSKVSYGLKRDDMVSYIFNSYIDANDPYIDSLVFYSTHSNKSSGSADKDIIKNLEELSNKYNEEFVFVEPMNDEELMKGVYAPIWDKSLQFTANLDGTRDTYKAVLAQKILSDKVNALIREEGAEDFIVQLSVPVCKNYFSEPYKKPYDTTDVLGNENFLDEVYLDDDYCTSLYYFVDDDGYIDYGMLHRLTEKIMSITHVKMKTTAGVYQRQDFFVFFYEIDKKYIPVITKLFKDDIITETKLRSSSKVSEIMKNMWWVTAETDGFDMLDAIGNKMDFMLKILEYEKASSTEEFVEMYRKANIYE